MGVLSPKQTGSGPLLCGALLWPLWTSWGTPPPWYQPLPLGKGQGLINFQLQSQGGGVGRDGSGRAALGVNEVEKIGQSGGKAASQGLVGVNSCGSVNLLPGSLVLTGVSGRSFSTSFCFPWSLTMVSFCSIYFFFSKKEHAFHLL